jgi:hypothetical protein
MKARVARIALVIALAVGLGLVAGKAHAQAYKYKDENGHVHFTEDYSEVPAKYRKHLETREMPAIVDPNAPQATPAEARTEVALQDSVRSVSGRDLTIKQQEALSKWWKTWGMTWMIVGGVTVLLQLAIHLGLIIHALTTDHIGWGIANFLVGVTAPIYLMMHVEQSVATRLGLLVLYFAPGIAVGVALSQVMRVLA